MAKPNKTIQQFQQEIRSLIQNFDWETNPDWNHKIQNIQKNIEIYWKNYLKRAYN